LLLVEDITHVQVDGPGGAGQRPKRIKLLGAERASVRVAALRYLVRISILSPSNLPSLSHVVLSSIDNGKWSRHHSFQLQHGGMSFQETT
jgi:hypothetical protein